MAEKCGSRVEALLEWYWENWASLLKEDSLDWSHHLIRRLWERLSVSYNIISACYYDVFSPTAMNVKGFLSRDFRRAKLRQSCFYCWNTSFSHFPSIDGSSDLSLLIPSGCLKEFYERSLKKRNNCVSVSDIIIWHYIKHLKIYVLNI